MGKLLLAVAAVASMSFTHGGTSMGGGDNDPVPTITISPKPPSQGGRVTIYYTGKPGTVLDLDWDPAGTPTSCTIDSTGKAHVIVPSNASSLIVHDPTGGANDASTVVVP
jgi:hypothetical protein